MTDASVKFQRIKQLLTNNSFDCVDIPVPKTDKQQRQSFVVRTKQGSQVLVEDFSETQQLGVSLFIDGQAQLNNKPDEVFHSVMQSAVRVTRLCQSH